MGPKRAMPYIGICEASCYSMMYLIVYETVIVVSESLPNLPSLCICMYHTILYIYIVYYSYCHVPIRFVTSQNCITHVIGGGFCVCTKSNQIDANTAMVFFTL